MRSLGLAAGVVLISFASANCSKESSTDSGAGTTSSSNSFLYVANRTDRSISIFKVDSSGAQPAVTLVDTLIPSTAVKPEILRVNAAGTLLYVSENGDGGNNSVIRAMTINRSTGIPSTTSSIALAQTTYFAKGFGLDREGKFAFVSHYIPSTDTLLIPVSLGTTGTSLALGTAFDVTGEQMQAPQAHPTLNRIYSASIGTNEVMSYTYDATTGALAQNAALTSGGSQPRGVAVHPKGTFLVAYHGASSSVLRAIPLNASGDLGTGVTTTQVRSLSSLYFYYDFVFHPKLDVAYGVANGPELIAPFTVNTTTSTLTELGASVSTGSTGANPISMVIDPSGKFAFVANNGADNLAVFVIDQTTGALTAATTPTIAVGDGPQSLQIVAAP